jgi:hypothetical protein
VGHLRAAAPPFFTVPCFKAGYRWMRRAWAAFPASPTRGNAAVLSTARREAIGYRGGGVASRWISPLQAALWRIAAGDPSPIRKGGANTSRQPRRRMKDEH